MSEDFEYKKTDSLYRDISIPVQVLNYTYILLCADGSYYCGWTNNLAVRLKKHNAGNASKYTRARRPVKLVYYEMLESRNAAMKREAEIKTLNRKAKDRLIREFAKTGAESKI